MYERYAPSVDFTPDLEHAKSMFDNDATLEYLGATITRLEPGLAEGEFTVEARHANGFGVCQGGVLFTFADALFGGACNSRRTDPTVSAQSEMIYLAPAKIGRTIRGVARERHTLGQERAFGRHAVRRRHRHRRVPRHVPHHHTTTDRKLNREPEPKPARTGAEQERQK